MTKPPSRLFAGLVALLAWSSIASAARAQDDEEERTAAGRALFEAAMEFVDQGDYAQAADRFERSLELRFSPVVAYNLSTTLIELERFVEASERLREILRAEEAPAEIREVAQERLDFVTSRIGQLTIRVRGSADTVEVRRGGLVVADALIGVPQPVDPGVHAITLHRDGEELVRREVTVTAGQSAEVTLEAPAPPEPDPVEPPSPEATARTAAPVASEPVPTPAAGESSIFESPWLWLGVAVVIGGAIATALLLGGGEPEPHNGDFEPPVVELGR